MSGPVLPYNFTERMRSKSHQEDLNKTMSFIRAREYSLTTAVLKNSVDISFSMVYKIINTKNYQENYDEYDEQMKKWTFSFSGSTPDGDDLLITVCADADQASIINVKRLKKNSSTLKKSGYILSLKKVCQRISKEKFTYSTHAKKRMKERNLTPTMVQDVLCYGAHESSQDRLKNGRWSFTFRDKDIRVCVSNKKNHASITTAINLAGRDISCFPSKKPFIDTQDKSEELSFDELLQLKTFKSVSPSSSSRKRKSRSSEPASITPQKKLNLDS